MLNFCYIITTRSSLPMSTGSNPILCRKVQPSSHLISSLLKNPHHPLQLCSKTCKRTSCCHMIKRSLVLTLTLMKKLAEHPLPPCPFAAHIHSELTFFRMLNLHMHKSSCSHVVQERYLPRLHHLRARPSPTAWLPGHALALAPLCLSVQRYT